MTKKRKTALIIGASGGIGSALVVLCAEQGYKVLTLSRRTDGLDITDEDSVCRHAKTIRGGLDLVVIATGALEVDGLRPEKTMQNVSAAHLLKQFQTNALGPALLLKYFAPKLTKARRSVMIVLSSRVGSIGENYIGGWVSYRAAKAALNQIVRTAAIELEHKNPRAICIAYHPGTVLTDMTQKYLKGKTSVLPKDAVIDLMSVVDRLSPRDTGQFLDWAGKKAVW
ncbi:MAG: SDR family NAD(P)-dependent oxidoreductase [Proteobacteria bacterium]|nr:SDR family NAD(P)-dependent oxidoreductase [Pseudomonadota bacterium]